MDPAEVLALLKRRGTRATRNGMARYGIVASHAFGVPMRTLLDLRKQLGRDHALALALWKSGWYEARQLAALVGEPERLTIRQMNAWATSFENWADCDTVCFHLFDRSALAWDRAPAWAKSSKEFVKRGGFVLMACLALHDKASPHRHYLRFLPLIEEGAQDERNFVQKGVSWALRSIGRRHSSLRAPAIELARRLASSASPAHRWVGQDALRDFTRKKAKWPLRG